MHHRGTEAAGMAHAHVVVPVDQEGGGAGYAQGQPALVLGRHEVVAGGDDDGRPHPDDPDPTFHGHSIGHWEGETLVVDTVGVVPQAYIAISEAAGVPNNGDMRIKERIYLAAKDVLHVDLEITAPKVLTAPWKTTRIYFRQRARKFDIVEGVCLEGYFKEGTDKDGNAIYVPVKHEVGGNRAPPE